MAEFPDRIVDAHHHLWDLSVMQHTWLAEKGMTRFFGDPAPIQKNYHVSDFRDDHGRKSVRASVHIQCGVAEKDAILETQWVQTQANENGMVGAIVAFVDLTKNDASKNIEAHTAFPLLRGIRQIVGRNAKEDARNGTNALLEDRRFYDGLKSIAGRGLSFDLQLTPPLLDAATQLFSKIEDLPVALCHAGSPQDFTKRGMQNWETGLKAFAHLPNAICKISGLGMFDHGWSVDSLRERVLRAIDAFGPDRIAFGSNFPVDKLYRSYDETFGAFINLTESFSKAERDDMFFNVAKSFYRVEV